MTDRENAVNLQAVTGRPSRADVVFIGLLTVGIILAGLVTTVRGTQFVISTALVPDLTLADLTRYADVIVTANATGQSKQVREPQGIERSPTVLTHTTFRVLNRHKGSAGSEIALTTRGGKMQGVVHIAEDEPTYNVGDRVILFLRTEPDGSYSTVGAYQGSFVIRGNVATNGDSQLDEAELISVISQGR
jgi:hypothetical protein